MPVPSAYADVSEDERQAERQPFAIMESAMDRAGTESAAVSAAPEPAEAPGLEKNGVGAAGGDLPVQYGQTAGSGAGRPGAGGGGQQPDLAGGF